MFPVHDDSPRINGRPYVNYGLIALNIAIFVYEVIVTSNFSNRFAVLNLFLNYGEVPSLILSGQNLQSIFTSMFMHGSIAHLVGNMFFLYVFGDNLEGRFGHLKYLLLYFMWGTVASITHSIYAISIGQGEVPAIGASGAISGVLGAFLIFFPYAKIRTIIFAFLITFTRIPALVYIPIWFILQLIFALIGQSGGVAYLAHIGGFAAGVGTAYCWKFISLLFSQEQDQRKIVKKIPYYSINANKMERGISPEIIFGNDFIDVIIEEPNITSNSNIKTNFDNLNNNLFVYIIDQNKQYSIPISNPIGHKIVISSISVNNGIIKIMLDLL